MKHNAPQYVLRISPHFKERIVQTASLRHRTVNSSANFAVDGWLANSANPSDSRVMDAMANLSGSESLGIRLEGQRRAMTKARAKEFGITMNCAFLLAFEDWIASPEGEMDAATSPQDGESSGRSPVQLSLSPRLRERIEKSQPGATLQETILLALENMFPERSVERELTHLLQAAGLLQTVLPDASRQALSLACVGALAAFRAGQPDPGKDLSARIRSTLRVFDEALPPRMSPKGIHERAQDITVQKLSRTTGKVID